MEKSGDILPCFSKAVFHITAFWLLWIYWFDQLFLTQVALVLFSLVSLKVRIGRRCTKQHCQNVLWEYFPYKCELPPLYHIFNCALVLLLLSWKMNFAYFCVNLMMILFFFNNDICTTFSNLFVSNFVMLSPQN